LRFNNSPCHFLRYNRQRHLASRFSFGMLSWCLANRSNPAVNLWQTPTTHGTLDPTSTMKAFRS
jgi:hypothetical protein